MYQSVICHKIQHTSDFLVRPEATYRALFSMQLDHGTSIMNMQTGYITHVAQLQTRHMEKTSRGNIYIICSTNILFCSLLPIFSPTDDHYMKLMVRSVAFAFAIFVSSKLILKQEMH